MKRAFLSKIQNHTSEETRKKIVLLSCKKFVKTQFWGVVVFPSNFWPQNFKVVVFPSHFWFQKYKVVVFPSHFWFQNFKVVVFPSNFWKTTIIWQFFRVILNFSQECYYLKNKVGVVDFTKARGPFGPLGFKTLPLLGRLQNLLLPLYFWGNVFINHEIFNQSRIESGLFWQITWLFQKLIEKLFFVVVSGKHSNSIWLGKNTDHE